MKCEILLVSGQKVYVPAHEVKVDKGNAILLNFFNEKDDLVAQFNVNSIIGWTLRSDSSEVRQAA